MFEHHLIVLNSVIEPRFFSCNAFALWWWQRSYAFECPEVPTGENYFMKLTYPFKVGLFFFLPYKVAVVNHALVEAAWIDTS